MGISDQALQAHEVRFRQSEPQQAWNWARSACEYAYSVQITGPDFDPGHAGTFWLRLHGVLVDLRKYLAGVPGSSRALQAIDGIRAALSHDELLWTQYRRDSECHVIVDSYAPIKGNGAPRADVKVKTLPGEPSMPWPTFNDGLDSALRPHLEPRNRVNPEHGLARSMAAKVCNPLELLLVALFDPLTQEAVRLGRPFLPSRPIRPTK